MYTNRCTMAPETLLVNNVLGNNALGNKMVPVEIHCQFNIVGLVGCLYAVQKSKRVSSYLYLSTWERFAHIMLLEQKKAVEMIKAV